MVHWLNPCFCSLNSSETQVEARCWLTGLPTRTYRSMWKSPAICRFSGNHGFSTAVWSSPRKTSGGIRLGSPRAGRGGGQPGYKFRGGERAVGCVLFASWAIIFSCFFMFFSNVFFQKIINHAPNQRKVGGKNHGKNHSQSTGWC